MRTAPNRILAPATTTSAPINLNQGAAIIVDDGRIVRTVLGSCVAVILHVPRLRVSGICHAQMPERQGSDDKCSGSCPEPCYAEVENSNDLKYVTCCIRYMLDQLLQRRVLRSEIAATLIGGASVLSFINPSLSVGERNVAVAKARLEEEGIRIGRADTGGKVGRTIQHNPATNETTVRRHDPHR